MSTVAAGIRIELPGLFGPDGRYYEFRRPLELIAEQDSAGNWIHSLWEFNLWTVEPTRAESLAAIGEYFTEVYESYVLGDQAKLSGDAKEYGALLNAAVRLVR